MKKTFKKLLSVLLCAVVASGFVACGDGDDGKPSVLDRTKELSNEVDKILLSKDILGEAERIAACSAGEDEVAFAGVSSGATDVSNPLDNEDYQDYLEWGRLTMDTTKTHLTNADTFVEEVKSVKSSVLNMVVQLNTWVGDSTQSEGGWRLSYDSVNDVATIETVSREDNYLHGECFNYYNIKAAQSEDGKALIEASFISTESGELNYRSSVRFFEDELWLYATEIKNQQTGQFTRIAVYADLVEGTIASVCDSEIALMKRGSERGYIVKNYNADNYNVFADNAQGERVAKAYYRPGVGGVANIQIDAYELNGWTGLFRTGENYELLLANGDVLTSGRSVVSVGDCSYTVNTTAYYCPYVQIQFEFTQDKTLSEGLMEVLSYLGLSFKDESVEDVFKGYDDIEEYRRSVQVFDEDGTFEPTQQEFERLFERIDIKSPSIEEMRVMTQAQKVLFGEQVQNEEYYQIYAAEFTGEVSLNEDTGLANLSQITVTAAQSALLEKGEYTLCFVLCDEFSSVLVKTVDYNYQGGAFSVSGCDGYDLNDAPNGEYVLKAYLARKAGGAYTRISKTTTLVASTAAYEKTINGESITVVAGEAGLKVLRAPVVQ